MKLGADNAEDDRERQLLEHVRAGDPEAFESLFVTHYEGMCALAYMMMRSRDATEDIVSNVFLRLWKRRHLWEPTGSVRGYLLAATRNEAINLIGRIQRERGLEGDRSRKDVLAALAAAAGSPEDVAAARETLAAVEWTVATLPRRRREVFLLRWREGLRYREIAERTGLAIKTVEMHVTRALREIRERLRSAS